MPETDVAPTESKKKTKPVEAQVDSDGDAEEAEKKDKEFKEAVAEAVRTQFDVKPTGWGIKTIVKFQVNFPSGQSALVKHLESTDLVRYDLLEELDFFVKRLFPPSYDAAGRPVEPDDGERQDIYATLRNPEKRLRFFDLTNRLFAVAAVEPRVINDGVALRYDEELGAKVDVFGHEVDDIDEQIALFGKPVPPLKDPEHETYAGAIDFTDRMTLFAELNKPLELIEPFRKKPDALLENLEREQSTGDSAE